MYKLNADIDIKMLPTKLQTIMSYAYIDLAIAKSSADYISKVVDCECTVVTDRISNTTPQIEKLLSVFINTTKDKAVQIIDDFMENEGEFENSQNIYGRGYLAEPKLSDLYEHGNDIYIVDYGDGNGFIYEPKGAKEPNVIVEQTLIGYLKNAKYSHGMYTMVCKGNQVPIVLNLGYKG